MPPLLRPHPPRPHGPPWLALALLAALWAPLPPASADPITPPALTLAQPYRPGLVLGDYWVSEKYDGVRGYWDGQQLWSRGGQPIMAPAWFTAGWPAQPLDGELWAGRGQFAHAQSTTRQQQPDDAAWRRMRFMVFDLPGHAGPFDARLPALQRQVAVLGLPWVQAAPQQRIHSPAQLQRRLDQVVRAGGEGLMLRRGDAPYRSGRSEDLVKLKPLDDAEAVVVAHLPGKGRYAGLTGALLVEMPGGQRFRLGSGLNQAERQHPPPVGSTVTYRHHGWNASGLPRFARFWRVREPPATPAAQTPDSGAASP